MSSSSGVTATNGQIYVDGQPFQLRGINMYSTELEQWGAQDVTSTFPNINFVRLNVYDPTTDTAATLAPYVDQLTSEGVVVEIEDHNYPTILTGTALQQAAQWYSSLATEFANNPDVIFGTQNEPSDDTGGSGNATADINTEISTIYNAVRSAGDQNLIMVNPYGGYNTQGLNLAGMTNVAWDLHFYNWVSNYSTSLSANVSALDSEVANAEATDNIPVIIGEYGTEGGPSADPGGVQVVQAVEQSGLGSAAWAWTSGDSAQPLLLTDGNGNPADGLTQFGQMTQQFIAGGSSAPASSGNGYVGGSTSGGSTSGGGGTTTTGGGGTSNSAVYITPGTGSFEDAAGNTYTLTSADVAMENGAAIPNGSGTAEMAYYNGAVYGEDASSSQWYTWNQTTWSTAAAPPAASSGGGGTTTGGGGTTTGGGGTTTGGGGTTTGGGGTTTGGGGTTTGGGGTSTGVSVTYITPGTGSFKDAAGNTYTLTSADVAMENGAAIPNGSGTAEMAYYNGAVYGEDASSSQWYTWNQTTWSTAAAPPPAASSGSTSSGSTSGSGSTSSGTGSGTSTGTSTTGGSTSGGGSTTTTASATYITPGTGSFKDAAGNTYTLTSADVAMENGAAIPNGSGTAEMAYYNGTVYGEDASSSQWYTWNQTTWSTAAAPPPASVTETSNHGSLAENLSQTGTYKVGSDTFVLAADNAVTVTLGTGTSQIKFFGANSITLTGGSGQATVSADTGTNTFTAGSGSLAVTGGAGKDAYIYHATSGALTIEDFSLARGDTLTIDKSLKASLHLASDGQGGTSLTFTGSTHSIDLHDVATFTSSEVKWA
jgi:hypothetical protein